MGPVKIISSAGGTLASLTAVLASLKLLGVKNHNMDAGGRHHPTHCPGVILSRCSSVPLPQCPGPPVSWCPSVPVSHGMPMPWCPIDWIRKML